MKNNNFTRTYSTLKISLFLIMVLSAVALPAQQKLSEEQYIQDSLKIVRVKLIRPQFKLDNRVAFYKDQTLATNGFDLGVLLSNKLRFTLGYYSLNGTLKDFNTTINGEKHGRLIEMNYGSINTELIYRDWRYFSLGTPLEICAGLNTFKDKNITKDQVYSTNSGALVFINFGVSGTFKPMRFLGLKAIAGYRKQVFNQVKDFTFDGFFTSVGLNIDVYEIKKDIKMYRLMKKYKKGNNLTNLVDIVTD